MTNISTKTYLVGVIERAIAYYTVEAEDARSAAENWHDGEFHDRDDEALESEGPCNVRVKQPNGRWMKLPPSEWEAEPTTAAPAMLKALEAFIEADKLAEECGEWKWENLDHAFKLARAAIIDATGETPSSGNRTLIIEVRGGIVQDVSNIPPGWDYEIIDHDNAE